MSNKGFVLYPFLLLFLSLIILINDISVNEYRKRIEFNKASEMDHFSLVEIETIRMIKKQFLSFKPKAFTITIGNWEVQVTFKEETVFITYTGKFLINAELDYDMVFENIMDYRLIRTTESDSH
ncbi:MAG: hypothetical protein FD133_1638 [Erysipelotrichaceae bacterium]|nr:MAG: hypothetical protein FD179_672 [Erysipelotrichaceae bacterium]TXT16861.1 MAG: hypothetical protein FD133_1638 [Erysipelotrichaceae bacterium]